MRTTKVHPRSPISTIVVCCLDSISQARTQTFEKGGANLWIFTKEGANLKKILILKPKLEV